MHVYYSYLFCVINLWFTRILFSFLFFLFFFLLNESSITQRDVTRLCEFAEFLYCSKRTSRAYVSRRKEFRWNFEKHAFASSRIHHIYPRRYCTWKEQETRKDIVRPVGWPCATSESTHQKGISQTSLLPSIYRPTVRDRDIEWLIHLPSEAYGYRKFSEASPKAESGCSMRRVRWSDAKPEMTSCLYDTSWDEREREMAYPIYSFYLIVIVTLDRFA